MSSSIENLVQNIELNIAEREEMENLINSHEAMEKKKTTVSTRFDSMQIAYLDMLADKCELSRSAMLNELSVSALMDVMEKMGLKEEFFDKLTKNVKKGTSNV